MALDDDVNGIKETLNECDEKRFKMLMEYSVTRLAPFFGRTRANDVLLSHMITFLNDKEDAQLRNSFYENIVGVATYVGWQCSLILQPLLQQVCIVHRHRAMVFGHLT